MKNRIIINIQGKISEEDAIRHVSQVIQEGRVSEAGGVKHYCWMTTWSNGIRVATNRKNKGQKSDSFVIWKSTKRKI